jgi:MFS transporter, FHS family, L-fucose permease
LIETTPQQFLDVLQAGTVLAQAFNSLGTTVAPWIGGWLILSTVVGSSDNKWTQAASVRLPYLGLGIIAFAMAIIMTRLRLPVLGAVEEDHAHHHTFLDALKIPHLALAVIAIFLYVGAEVSIGSYLISYIGLPSVTGFLPAVAATYVSYYWGGAMIGRFIGAAVLQRVQPQVVLGGNAIVTTLLCLCGFMLSGQLAMWAVIAIGFFNSIMFPNIFTLGISRLGHVTSQGSSLLIMAIVGGALVPIAMGKAADLYGLQRAMLIPAACYFYIICYAFFGSQPKKGPFAENL